MELHIELVCSVYVHHQIPLKAVQAPYRLLFVLEYARSGCIYRKNLSESRQTKHQRDKFGQTPTAGVQS